MTVQYRRQLSRDGQHYRISFVAGFHGSAPNVCWVEVFPVAHPLDDGIDRMAATALGGKRSSRFRMVKGHKRTLVHEDRDGSAEA